MRVVSLALLLACAGRASAPAPVLAAPPPPVVADAGPPPAVDVVLVPAGPPAERYGQPVAVGAMPPLSSEVAVAIGRAAVTFGRPVPRLDGALSAVAAEVARLPLAGGGPSIEVVQFTLAYHGVVEPIPYLLIYPLDAGDTVGAPARVEADMKEALASSSFTRLGVAQVEGGDGVLTLVVALQEGAVTLEPVPRELPSKGQLRLRGHVLAPFKGPRVFVTGSAGGVTSVPLVRDGDEGFRATVTCGADGPIKVEVMAADAVGSPTILANFPVWCGVLAPRSVTVTARHPVATDAASVEIELLRLANAERARAGLPPLVWDEHAAFVARAHSTDMRDHGFVGHVSPTSGHLEERARTAALNTPLLLENVARAQSAYEAHHGLMDSPGHRSNLLNPKVTHAGFGVAVPVVEGERDIFVTQLFLRVPPRTEPAELRRAVTQAIAAKRAAAGLTPVATDEELAAVAQAYATGLAAGRNRDGLAAGAGLGLDRVTRYRQIATVVAVVGDPADAPGEAALEKRAVAVGVGAAQGRHKDLGDGAIFVVMLFGRPR